MIAILLNLLALGEGTESLAMNSNPISSILSSISFIAWLLVFPSIIVVIILNNKNNGVNTSININNE